MGSVNSQRVNIPEPNPCSLHSAIADNVTHLLSPLTFSWEGLLASVLLAVVAAAVVALCVVLEVTGCSSVCLVCFGDVMAVDAELVDP